jgi:hypothetical protein
MAIRPSSKLKGYRTGAEVDYVDLRRWFFCYTRMSSGSTFQQFNHQLAPLCRYPDLDFRSDPRDDGNWRNACSHIYCDFSYPGRVLSG